MNPSIIKLTKDFTPSQFNELSVWAHQEEYKRDPVIIAQYARMRENAKQREILEKEKAAYSEKVSKFLRGTLTTGQKLKMKGCKDGSGLREFIRWDSEGNLVCWQIHVRKEFEGYGPNIKGGRLVIKEEKTDQVTKHMPDKVQKVMMAKNGPSEFVSIKTLIK